MLLLTRWKKKVYTCFNIYLLLWQNNARLSSSNVVLADGSQKVLLLGLSDKNIFIYIYIVYLFIFSHVCCSYSVDRFQSVISWGWGGGGAEVSAKKDLGAYSLLKIYTLKFLAELRQHHRHKTAAPTSFSSRTHVCWHLVQLSRTGAV